MRLLTSSPMFQPVILMSGGPRIPIKSQGVRQSRHIAGSWVQQPPSGVRSEVRGKRHHDRGASAEDALLLVAVNTLLVVVDALLVTVGATVSIVDSGGMVVAEAHGGGYRSHPRHFGSRWHDRWPAEARCLWPANE